MTKSERRWLMILTVITVLAFIPIAVLNFYILEYAIYDGFKEALFGTPHSCYDIFKDCCCRNANIEEMMDVFGVEIAPYAVEV